MGVNFNVSHSIIAIVHNGVVVALICIFFITSADSATFQYYKQSFIKAGIDFS